MSLGEWTGLPGPEEPAASRWRRWLGAAAFVVAYVLLDWASYIDPLLGLNITPWSPAPALGILFLLRRGLASAPVLLLAVLAGDLTVRGSAMHPAMALVLDLGLTAGYGVIVELLRRHAGGDGLFADRAGFVRWSGIIVFGSLVNSLVFVAGLTAGGMLPADGWSDGVLRFWIGDGVGIFVALPLFAWLQDARHRLVFAAVLSLETAAYSLLAGIALWVAFVPGAEAHFRYFYVLFLPLVWAASRQGVVGAVFCTTLLQLGMLLAGWLAEAEAVSLFELQMRSLLLALVGFLIGVAVDEQRRSATDLRQSLRLAAAGEMAGALAHELNQPLTALAAYGAATDRLLARGDGDPLLRDTVRKMVAEAARAAEVVRRLRDFFRTGSTHLETLSLEGVLDAAIDSFRERAARQGVILSRAPVPEVQIHADRLQLEVVLRNLLANACDAVETLPAERPRSVAVVTERLGVDQLCIRVEDSGPGLSAAMIGRVFEPFVSTKSSGLGLGLAISRAIVEAHGGSLVLEVGDRGCVKLTLPVKLPGPG